ncbi:MAG: DNA-3-methyladenine glycosylase [Cytophagales bacterium]|nr:DNA-3-methyladenine glycosylase [Cytophagales bacterium]
MNDIKAKWDHLPRLSEDFYTRDDVVRIAKDLIGKYVFTQFQHQLTGGRIVETEAYSGRFDKACHAFLKRTKRTETMYQTGGIAYIYLCYGIHHMFNIVTNKEGLADAVLIRAVEPVIGLDTIIDRRGGDKKYTLTKGPGSLGQALGFNKSQTGTSLIESEVMWLAEDPKATPLEMEIDRRVGVDYAQEDALLPWRFFEKGSKWVSKKVQKPLILADSK